MCNSISFMIKNKLNFQSNLSFAIKQKKSNSFATLVFTILVIISTTFSVKAQDDSSTNDSIVVKPKVNKFFMPSVGLTIPTFRDFATSPLYYQGIGMDFGLAWLWQKENWENLLETDLNFATLISLAPISEYFQVYSNAFLFSGNIYNHYIRRVEKFSNDKFNLKIGGAFASTSNVRINSSLSNNGAGLESFANLMFTVKASKDISRTVTKQFKLWFIKKKLKPAVRDLSVQGNIGVINLNYRPGYAYIYDGEINGTDYSSVSSVMAGHKWKMNGWRVGTRIEYSKFRPSGNGFKLAYIWEVASVPGRFEIFQMASHRIQYTLIINRN